MQCNPIDPTVLAANLADARTAYHQLMTGTKARVIVDQNGERVEFTSANKDDLKAYIGELEALLCPTPMFGLNPSRPVGFLF